jgi:hypothetical protein
MRYAEFVNEDRRLVILRLLHQAPGNAANSSVIDKALHRLGHRVTRDIVKGDLAWLQEHDLITVEDMSDVDLLVATLTGRGQEVATGERTVTGVARPSLKG